MSSETRTMGVEFRGAADLEGALRYAVSGVRDPEVMRQAAESMDRLREEVRQKRGIVDDRTFASLLSDEE